MVRTLTLTVAGMTCEHCARSVTEEVSRIPGVVGVDVDLASGAVTVGSDNELELGAVARAVAEAGYEVVR